MFLTKFCKIYPYFMICILNLFRNSYITMYQRSYKYIFLIKVATAYFKLIIYTVISYTYTNLFYKCMDYK
jgi:hypothetical protein